MKTVKQLQDEIRAQIWPSGEPENLKVSPVSGVLSAHDAHFQEAFADISKWCPCEQEGQVNIIEFCKTFFKCGMTIVAAPRGNIRRVIVVVGDDYCDPVTYVQVAWPVPECLGRNISSRVPEMPVPDFPLGFASASSATDATCGRARSGVWAIHKGNIYIYPWIQSVEKVLIEWDGIKKIWAEGDPVNEAQDYRKAVKLYCQFAHERDYGTSQKANEFKFGNPPGSGGYDQALAELIWQCAQENKTRETDPCLPCACPSPLLCGMDEETGIAATVTGLVLAHIGDFGTPNSGVVNLVRSWDPSAILIAGPNETNYDAGVGASFHDFLKPYYGAHGDGGDTNKVWPAAGNTDWLDGLAAYRAFFALPNPRRYYEVCIGLVHLFVLDLTTSETDGFDAASVQAQWLRAKLLLSPARWKVVMSFASGYSSTSGFSTSSILGVQTFQWPFREWGADLVLSGARNYERLEVGGLPYINNGVAGNQTATNNVPDPNTKFFSVARGAGKMTVSRDTLLYEFRGTDDALIDSLELTK